MKIFTLFSLFIALSATASGVMQITGKLISIQDHQIGIETKNSVYTINKDSIEPTLLKTLTHPNTMVSVNIPFDGVLKVPSKPR